MIRENIISSFNTLGKILSGINSEDSLLIKTQIENQWFIPQYSLMAINYWSQHLKTDELTRFVKNYNFNSHQKTVGLVTAGNLPLVGFHDLMCILLSGHKCKVKLSSSDSVLMKFAIDSLCEINSEFKYKISIVEKLDDCDAYIATGSNNTSRYFEYYFRKKPNIIRRNRNSIAIITGNETDEDLKNLAFDIFSYFGLGCRNVSKIFVPDNYDFSRLFNNFEEYRFVENHNKYFNNYVYHKAIFLMNITPHLDNGFLLLKEDESFYSPLSCLFYSFYKNFDEVEKSINANSEKIQIVVGNNNNNFVKFGNSQTPDLNDFADQTDTMLFLSKL